MKHKFTKKRIALYIIILIIGIYLISIYNSTGFLQGSKIDEKDLSYWTYDGNIIQGTDEYAFIGSTETCWLLIHSYTATPLELKDLGREININLGDMVYGIKLSGHGEVPSHLEGKNLDVWYQEIQRKYRAFSGICDNINVVGSSYGAVLALRLAEENEIKNIYILNPFLKKTYKLHKIIPFELRAKLFSGILVYKKKNDIANINYPQGRQAHVSYWNMPYGPIKDSLPFIKTTTQNLPNITSPIFIAYSENDEVAGSYSAIKINNTVSSNVRGLFDYKRSNHVLLMDYDRLNVINDVIKFEEMVK